MMYNETTGTFSLNGKQVCRGYYGTTTSIVDEIGLQCSSAQQNWTLTVANNGTTVRIFSIPRTELDNFDPITRLKLWRYNEERAWFMATFKHLDGHLRNWGTKNNNFGGMFEEIVGEQGIKEVMDATSGNLCISYFIRHPDNDIYGELEEPEVLQTIAWNSETNRYISTFDLEPPHGIHHPIRITPVPTDSVAYVKIEDGTPLILTTFLDDGDIKSTKYITKHDEYLRMFRCRTHNRFAALFATERLHESEKDAEKRQVLEDELMYARSELFTPDELEQFEVTVKAARDELNNDLHNKLNGKYVVFPNKMYMFCDIKKIIDSYQGNNSKENHMAVRDRVWKKLAGCTDTKTIGAVEQFIQHYGKMIVE